MPGKRITYLYPALQPCRKPCARAYILATKEEGVTSSKTRTKTKDGDDKTRIGQRQLWPLLWRLHLKTNWARLASWKMVVYVLSVTLYFAVSFALYILYVAFVFVLVFVHVFVFALPFLTSCLCRVLVQAWIVTSCLALFCLDLVFTRNLFRSCPCQNWKKLSRIVGF